MLNAAERILMTVIMYEPIKKEQLKNSLGYETGKVFRFNVSKLTRAGYIRYSYPRGYYITPKGKNYLKKMYGMLWIPPKY